MKMSIVRPAEMQWGWYGECLEGSSFRTCGGSQQPFDEIQHRNEDKSYPHDSPF